VRAVLKCKPLPQEVVLTASWEHEIERWLFAWHGREGSNLEKIM
jgi:hypothetical protein